MSRILYKYLDIEGAKCMIGKHNLQFTNATQLNDPFDCHPKLIDYSKESYPNMSEEFKEWWIQKKGIDADNLRNNTWLCSLSKMNDSILMWSHYCYNHKGVCIGLNIDKVMECIPPLFGLIYTVPLVLEVQYVDIINRPKESETPTDIFNYQWVTKAKDWEYEKEVRLVIPRPNSAYAALTPAQVKNPKEMWDGRELRYYIELNGDCFESIYFGINIDPKEKNKIIEYARKQLNPDIKLFQMRVDDNAFRMNPEAIE